MGAVHRPRATGPAVRDAALEYLQRRQDNNNNNAGNGNNNNNDNANNGNNANNNNGNNGDNANNNNGNTNNGNNNNNNNNNANSANSGSNNAQPTGSVAANATVSGGSGNSTANSSVSIPMTAAAGSIVMLQPPQTGSASYYKIAPSETITFKWNMTDLYVQPTSLTVVASCSDNGNTYPVGPTDGNQNVFDGNTTEVHWCPYEWQDQPGQPRVIAASYTLQIWDERGKEAVRKGGYLTPFSGTKFGMYLPQAYTPLADWKCTTCSGAVRLLGDPAGFPVMMSLVVMIVSAWAVLRRH